MESQGLTRMAVHPHLQHLVVLDQTAHHLPLASQQPYYQVSSPLILSHGFTPPPGNLHQSGIFRPLSNPGAHLLSVQPAMQSWTPPPRPATTTGIPGILGEGIYKVSRVGTSSSSRSRGRKFPTISESQDRSNHTVSRHFNRAESFSKKRTFQRENSQASETENRKVKLVRPLSQKYSTARHMSIAPERVPVNEFMSPNERQDTTNVPQAPSAATELVAANVRREPQLPCNPRSTLKLTDLEELAKNSQSKTNMLPPSIRESRLIHEFIITQEGLTGVTNVWNELMERGQIETECVNDLREAHKIWARLGHEWVQQLQSRVAATVGKLRKVRGETGC